MVTSAKRLLLLLTVVLMPSCVAVRWGHLDAPERWPVPPAPEDRPVLCVEWFGNGVGTLSPWLCLRMTQVEMDGSQLFRSVNLVRGGADLVVRYDVKTSEQGFALTAMMLPLVVFSNYVAPMLRFAETSVGISYWYRDGEELKGPIKLEPVREDYAVASSWIFLPFFLFFNAESMSTDIVSSLNRHVVHALVERDEIPTGVAR